MNCEQCKEDVLELIERAAIDPAGVQEILNRCPDCRTLFDDMNAALVVVDQLPLEDPPSRVDAEVLRAAAMRRANVTPLRKWRLQAPPWAMAAIALLAVGIGVWSIPPSGDVATEDALGTGVVETEGDVVAEQKPVGAREETAQASSEKAEARVLLDQREPVKPRAEAPAKSPLARRERGQAKRKALSAPVQKANAPEAAPTESFAADAVAGLGMLEEAKEDRDDKADEACRKTVADFQKRSRRDEDYAPDPEQQLALGRCYAKLGDIKRARTWLERAATHPKTKTRAREVLEGLASD